MSKVQITEENAVTFAANVIAKANAVLAKEGLNITIAGSVSESDEVGVVIKCLIQAGKESLTERYWRQWHVEYGLPADAMGKTVTIPTEGKNPSIDEYKIIGIGNSSKYPVLTECKTDGAQYPFDAETIIGALNGSNKAKIEEVKKAIVEAEEAAAEKAAKKIAKKTEEAEA